MLFLNCAPKLGHTVGLPGCEIRVLMLGTLMLSQLYMLTLSYWLLFRILIGKHAPAVRSSCSKAS